MKLTKLNIPDKYNIQRFTYISNALYMRTGLEYMMFTGKVSEIIIYREELIKTINQRHK